MVQAISKAVSPETPSRKRKMDNVSPTISAKETPQSRRKKARRGPKSASVAMFTDPIDPDFCKPKSHKNVPKPRDFKEWSTAKQKAWFNIDVNPNAFYYRHCAPEEIQRNGKWSEEEKKHFLHVLTIQPPNGQWGLIAMRVPGRVGYQCRNYYHLLLSQGCIKDRDYTCPLTGKYTRYKQRNGKRRQRTEGDTDSVIDSETAFDVSDVQSTSPSFSDSYPSTPVHSPESVNSDSAHVRMRNASVEVETPRSEGVQLMTFETPSSTSASVEEDTDIEAHFNDVFGLTGEMLSHSECPLSPIVKKTSKRTSKKRMTFDEPNNLRSETSSLVSSLPSSSVAPKSLHATLEQEASRELVKVNDASEFAAKEISHAQPQEVAIAPQATEQMSTAAEQVESPSISHDILDVLCFQVVKEIIDKSLAAPSSPSAAPASADMKMDIVFLEEKSGCSVGEVTFEANFRLEGENDDTPMKDGEEFAEDEELEIVLDETEDQQPMAIENEAATQAPVSETLVIETVLEETELIEKQEVAATSEHSVDSNINIGRELAMEREDLFERCSMEVLHHERFFGDQLKALHSRVAYLEAFPHLSSSDPTELFYLDSDLTPYSFEDIKTTTVPAFSSFSVACAHVMQTKYRRFPKIQPKHTADLRSMLTQRLQNVLVSLKLRHEQEIRALFLTQQARCPDEDAPFIDVDYSRLDQLLQKL